MTTESVSCVEDELAQLRSLCPGVKEFQEQGGRLIYLPKLRFMSGGTEHCMDVLLSPHPAAWLGGYQSRLLLERTLPLGLNWSVVSALGRQWHTFSWNGVPDHLSLVEKLGNHLRALA